MLKVNYEYDPVSAAVVEAGQVRGDNEGRVILAIDGDSHAEIRENIPKDSDERFLAMFLASGGDPFCEPFGINENYGMSSASDLQESFPIVLDAELTIRRRSK